MNNQSIDFYSCLCLLGVMLCLLTACAGGGGSGLSQLELLRAIELDDVSYVHGNIQRGILHANQILPVPGYPEGAPLVTVVAREGALNVMRYLIAARADLNARTPTNETALMLAAYFYDERHGVQRHDQIVRLLVEAGANLENDIHSYTPLSYAAYSNRGDALRYLLERGARVDASARGGVSSRNTPLMMAAMQGHTELVRLLLRAGADPSIRVLHGATATEFALKYRHAQIEYLLACAQSRPLQVSFAAHCEGVQSIGAR